MTKATTLWLVRHAQPLVAPGICYGATDLPADAAATRLCADDLALRLPRGCRVRSSPLQRCTQLTEALIALRPDLQTSVDPRLAEMDFGCWEGWRWDAIPRAAIDAWTAQFGPWRFGGRESVQQLLDRVTRAWKETRAVPGPSVWVTHAGVVRAALLLSRGTTVLTRSDQWPSDSVPYGSHRLVP